VIVATTIEQIRDAVAQARASGKVVGLVPTMGALHEGHTSLIEAAWCDCRFVAVSIFVNPTQFVVGEDFAAYPRTPEKDLAACAARGVDAVFMPAPETMYSPEALTTVRVAKLTETLCGRSRPGHFDGVCTVVAKLLNIVGPDRAYFGAKDYQQAVIVRQMVDDLNFPVRIVVCPTVREADGLAMSSRNAYLDPRQRRQAAELYKALQLAARMILRDRPPADRVIEAVRRHLGEQAPDGRIDYVQIVDPRTLQDVVTTDVDVLVALAVRFGGARLIDNICVDAAAERP